MRKFWNRIEQNRVWLMLLLGMDCFWTILLWISDLEKFKTLIGLAFLSSALLFVAVLYGVNKRGNTRRELFQAFLSDPSVAREECLLRTVSWEEREAIQLLAEVLREQRQENSCRKDMLRDYEEYVEGWAHEAKTPLSLLTMLLDNWGEEIDPTFRVKLDYVRSQLQEDITQMLYYARLKSSTKDYRLENVTVNECLEEILEDYAPLLEEKGFVVHKKLQTETVYTDRRGLRFMLSQIISNAIKYSSDQPILTVSIILGEQEDVISVEDNGMGVKSYDLPYIFQKGFTGDSANDKKKATGMGLYLTKKMADDLNLRLEAFSRWGEGFCIEIVFPK